MSSGPADRNIDWLPLTCPSCKVNLHIKMAYAHMQGRCPECGRSIEAPRPAPLRPTVTRSDSDDSPGLVPIEEEWPEPARVDGAGESAVYSLADSPPSPTEPKHQATAEEVFELADLAEPFSPAKVRPPAPAGAGLHTTAQPRQQHDHELDPLLIREPAPPPPDLPFVEGIYTFPWSGSNPRVWFILVLEMGVLVMLVSILRGLLHDGHPVIRAVLLPFLGVTIGIAFFTWGSYVAHCFLRVLEETAAGNRECEWECTGIVDRTGKFLYLLWLLRPLHGRHFADLGNLSGHFGAGSRDVDSGHGRVGNLVSRCVAFVADGKFSMVAAESKHSGQLVAPTAGLAEGLASLIGVGTHLHRAWFPKYWSG